MDKDREKLIDQAIAKLASDIWNTTKVVKRRVPTKNGKFKTEEVRVLVKKPVHR